MEESGSDEEEGGWAWVEATPQIRFEPPPPAPPKPAPPPKPQPIDEDLAMAALPQGFGRQVKVLDPKQVHDSLRRDQVPAAKDFSHLIQQKQTETKEEDDIDTMFEGEDDEEDEEDEDSLFQLPISHQVALRSDAKVGYCALRHHIQAISSLALDPSGSRLLTGDMGFMVRFWDFFGMDMNLQSFREVEASIGHEVNWLEYNESGSHFLVIVNSPQAKVFDREGNQEAETGRGDMYVYDKRKTPGHTHPICSGHWDPLNAKQAFFTASLDSTLRHWHVEDDKAIGFRSRGVVRCHKTNGKYVGICAMDVSPDGHVIATGAIDGSINVWNRDNKSEVPIGKYLEAHSVGANPPSVDITSLKFSEDNVTLISRSTDGTLKVWDIRMMKDGPAGVATDLPCLFQHTDAIFSPDERLIVTGTQARVRKKSMLATIESSVADNEVRTHGRLVFFNRYTMEQVMDTAVCEASVNRILWHSGLNQIFVGGSDGVTHVLYDPSMSKKGVLVSATRFAKQRDVTDDLDFQRIVAPNAPKMDGTRDSRGRPSKEKLYLSMNKMREDAQKEARARPEPPLPGSGHTGEGSGRGRGGRLGSALWTNVIQSSIARDEGDLRLHEDIKTSDPAKILREVGMQMQTDGDTGGGWKIDRAYKGTKQKHILDYEALELEKQVHEQQFHGGDASEQTKRRRGNK